MDPSLELSIEDDNDDVGLSARQIAALERLTTLGANPRENEDAPYDSNAQIRALQLVFEGKFGGAGRGQGRPKSDRRAAEILAEEIRKAPRVQKMNRALDRALSKKAGVRANLDAIKLSVEMENKERSLQIKEEEHEDNAGTKEDLIAALIKAVGEPATAAAIESEFEEIKDAEVVENSEINTDQSSYPTRSSEKFDSGENGIERNSRPFKKIGNNTRVSGKNGRKATSGDSFKGSGTIIKIKNRLPSD